MAVKKHEVDTGRIPGVVPVDDAALHLIDLALEEDRGPGDWTSRWTVPARTRVEARIVARAEGVVAGLGLAAAVWLRLDPRVDFDVAVHDGQVATAGQTVITLRGPGRAVLTGERTALNFLQRLSGIATLTRAYVDAVAGTGARITDTRKTTPGWRALEKAAVRAGGGENHRLGLYDMVMIKENHAMIAGGLAAAVALVRDQNGRGLPVAAEARDLEEVDVALEAGVDRILLDNMTDEMLARAVKRARKHPAPVVLEATGNMTLARVGGVAATGVDVISVGALTHSVRALDLSLLVT
ncbi:MAG: carboxylating nicotinate-nucleotide diphosphorylase [Gemmatimonadota bacterium]